MQVAKDMINGVIHTSNSGDKLEIANYVNSKEVYVRFLESQAVVVSSSSNIRAGKVKDPMMPSVHGVGFVGIGDHCVRRRGNITPEYRAWSGMLSRCYGNMSWKFSPTYDSCTVCDEWHNFQNFAEWYVNHQNYGLGYHLDKDSLQQSLEKVYSPSTCDLISPKENTRIAHQKIYILKNPDGVDIEIVNMRKFCIENNLTPPAMYNLHKGVLNSHKGWTRPG